MDSVKDKVVLITGSSSGLGAAAAVAFAKYGSRLVLTARTTSLLEKVAEECTQCGLHRDKILVISADITKDDDVKRIVDETVKYFSRIDVLVNNAGICITKGICDISMEEVDEQFNVNLRSVIHITKLTIPYLKETKGSIVNVSSVNGKAATTSFPAYCMTKAAIDMFTSSLTLELGSSGVRVNAVNPGDIRTPIHGKMGVPADQMNKFYEEIGKDQYPCQRVGLPHEVASAIVFLASDAASYIYGATLPVDGGQAQTTSWFQMEANQSFPFQAE